jgi:hypothetical protein
MKRFDLVLTEGPDGTVLAHKLDCPMVQQHRMHGRPLCTMIGCELPLPKNLQWHECWDEGGRNGGRAA